TPAFRQKLALSHVAVNDALAATAPAGAEAALRKALEEQSALLVEFPGVPEYESELGRSHYQLARLLLDRNKPVEAVIQAEQAESLYRKVLQMRPGSDAVRGLIVDELRVRAYGLIASGRLSEARDAAEQLPAIRADDSEAYRTAAALLVRCAAAAPSTTEGQRLADDSRDRAVKILRDAVQKNLIGSPVLLDHPDLSPLRKR